MVYPAVLQKSFNKRIELMKTGPLLLTIHWTVKIYPRKLKKLKHPIQTQNKE